MAPATVENSTINNINSNKSGELPNSNDLLHNVFEVDYFYYLDFEVKNRIISYYELINNYYSSFNNYNNLIISKNIIINFLNNIDYYIIKFGLEIYLGSQKASTYKLGFYDPSEFDFINFHLSYINSLRTKIECSPVE